MLPLGRTLILLAIATPTTWSQGIARINLSPAGAEANGASQRPVLSADAQLVLYESDATNLVPSDLNGVTDIFLHDRATGGTLRVSVDSSGAESDGASAFPALSADGRIAACHSTATNLVAGDANAATDVFVRDLALDTTTLISVGLASAPSDNNSIDPALSADGRYVAFQSAAGNLVAGDSNSAWDVFVFDRALGLMSRVSVGSAGQQANGGSSVPALSADGRFVAFNSWASNLEPLDNNGLADIFLRDLQLGTTAMLSVSPTGQVGNSLSLDVDLTPDAHFAVFCSAATNLVPQDTNGTVDVFRRDLQTGTTVRVSLGPAGAQGNHESVDAVVSADGARVAFQSYASTLAIGDGNGLPDVFLRKVPQAMTLLVSATPGGAAGNGSCTSQNVFTEDGPSISADGRFVAFQSFASDLVAGDTNGLLDIFVYYDPPAPFVYCSPKTTSLNCVPAISWLGAASASSGAGFVVEAWNVINNKPGLLMYGIDGQSAIPFQGGTLCVHVPIRRTTPVSSGGSPPPNDCSGVFAIDVNAFAAGALGGNPSAALSAVGAVVDCQWWGRDPGFAPPANTMLTDALEFVVGL